MSLRVVGAGFGRTGTLSLKSALEELLGAPCYHMMECMQRPDHAPLWMQAERGQINWDALFDGFVATVDWPSTRFWRELAGAYPESKVILSLRDPERWFESAAETIFKVITTQLPDGVEPPANLLMVKELIEQGTFGGEMLDRSRAIEIFEEHNRVVQETIDPDRLLVFEAKDGWQPLCDFLGVSIPDKPYPRVNSREEFGQLFGPGRIDRRGSA